VARARRDGVALARTERTILTHSRETHARRIIRRALWPQTEDRESFERLIDRADIWLRDETLSGDLMRPFSQIVADICRDLGLSPDWAVLAEEAWAREEASSGRPGRLWRDWRNRMSLNRSLLPWVSGEGGPNEVWWKGPLATATPPPPPCRRSPSPAAQGRSGLRPYRQPNGAPYPAFAR